MSEPKDDRFERAVAGDIAALGSLLNEHGPRLRDQLAIDPRWQSVLDPDDVMQVTYLDAFLTIHTFAPDGGHTALAAWLRRIAENNLRDAIRGLEAAKRPQPAIGQADGTDSTLKLMDALGITRDSPSRVVAAGERRQMIEAALDQMPEDYASVIRLYDLEGRPIEEVCKKMSRRAGAIHMLRARAHARLGECLGGPSEFFPE